MVTETVKPGYKKTEIGIIPEDWRLITFGTTFKFLSIAPYSRSELTSNGSIFYVHYGDIHTKWNSFLDLNKEELPSINKRKQKDYNLIKEGDLIIVDASEDYEGICKGVEVKNVDSKKIISGLHTFLLRDKNKYFADGFRGYITKNKLVKNQLNILATGLNVYGVSRGNLKSILIPCPDPKEQSAIAQVLSDTDQLIESLDKLIEKKKKIKKGTMQELLTGKKRLPGFSGEWEEKGLKEIAKNLTTGKLDANAMTLNGEYRFYTCSKEYYFTDNYAFDTEALLISGNGENVGYIHYYKGKFNAYQRTYVLSDFSENILFIKFLLDKNLKDRINVEVNAGNTPYIKKDTLSEMQVLIPKNPKEQSAIAQVLSDMDEEIEKLERKRDKYQQIKKGMMQKLLTGEIRLKCNQ